MIIYTGSFPIREGSHDEVRTALLHAREASLAEPGCLVYDFGVDITDGGRILFRELYEDREALDGHLQEAHTQELFALLKEHLDGRAEGTMYEAEVVRRDGGA